MRLCRSSTLSFKTCFSGMNVGLLAWGGATALFYFVECHSPHFNRLLSGLHHFTTYRVPSASFFHNGFGSNRRKIWIFYLSKWRVKKERYGLGDSFILPPASRQVTTNKPASKQAWNQNWFSFFIEVEAPRYLLKRELRRKTRFT